MHGQLLGAYAVLWYVVGARQQFLSRLGLWISLVLVCLCIRVKPLLPYALAFAAGAMVFVVVDELVPEAAASGNKRLSSVGTMIGFIIMMAMDVALG